MPTLLVVQVAMSRLITNKSDISASGDTSSRGRELTTTRETTLMLSTFITSEISSTALGAQERTLRLDGSTQASSGENTGNLV